MVDWYGFFWGLYDTARNVLPYMAQTACIGYGIVLVLKFVWRLLIWRGSHE